MTRDDVRTLLAFYFPESFGAAAPFHSSEIGITLLDRLVQLEKTPLTLTHLNQLLHLTTEAGISDGFFRYYFLSAPPEHPYPLDRVLPAMPALSPEGVGSLDQLRWGLHRFFMDGLLYFGNLRTAYRELHMRDYDTLVALFGGYRLDSDGMQRRGTILPFRAIPADDRYLIAEFACKAYSPPTAGAALPVEDMLLQAYRERGGGTIRIGDLFSTGSQLAERDPQAQMMLQFATEEFVDDTIDTEEAIREKVRRVAGRFMTARDAAIYNTRLYLSIVNELDIYVATSMRRRADFRDMSRDCESIFKSAELTKYHIRYFDPTNSAAEGHEDKGLLECLMVKCAKALVYFAGESDTFGKDAEVAMALSLGKPVIILCPTTPKGEERRRIFRDIHPLSRLIQMETGVACGAMITSNLADVALLLDRTFGNRMEYDLDHKGDGYFRLRERLTGSVVRLQTNFAMLRESFWNYYHGVG